MPTFAMFNSYYRTKGQSDVLNKGILLCPYGNCHKAVCPRTYIIMVYVSFGAIRIEQRVGTPLFLCPFKIIAQHERISFIKVKLRERLEAVLYRSVRVIQVG